MLANVMVFVWWVRMNEEEPCTQFYNSTFLRRNILVPAPFFFSHLPCPCDDETLLLLF